MHRTSTIRGGACRSRTLRLLLASMLVLATLAPAMAQVGAYPEITGVVPDRVTQGSLATLVRITGDGFPSQVRVLGPWFGDNVDVEVPGFSVSPAQVLSPREAIFTVSVSGEVPPGTYEFILQGYDPLDHWWMTIGSFQLTVTPWTGGLAVPVSVQEIAVVWPREGARVGRGQRIVPRGVLAVTGSGTVTGAWELDGVPFDRFVAVARGGEPVRIEGRVPLPLTGDGPHQVTLRIDSPAPLASDPVTIVLVGPRPSLLRPTAPAPGTIVRSGAATPAFSWTLQPGAVRYEVLLSRSRRMLPTTRVVAVTRPPFRPDPALLSELGPGRLWWSVRPVFTGEVRGTPSAWQPLLLLPERAALSSPAWARGEEPGSLELSWRDDTEGFLHRVEVVDPADPGRVLATGLTFGDRWTLRPALHGIRPGTPLAFRVVALAPGLVPAGELAGGRLPDAPAASRALRVADRVGEVKLEPADGAEVPAGSVTLGASWQGALDPDEVAIVVDGTDLTGICDVTPTSIACPATGDLGPGVHRALLALGERLVRWSFTVTGGGGETAPAPGAPGVEEKEEKAPAPAGPTTWRLDARGQLTWISGSDPDEWDQLRVSVSGSVDRKEGKVHLNGSGDVAFRRNLSGDHETIQESRNYVLSGTFGEGRWQGLAGVGYVAPRALAGSVYLDPGMPKGGAEIGVTGPIGTVTAYATYDSKPAGQVSGIQGAEQKVRAASWEIPLPRKLGTVRLMALDVTDPGSSALGLSRNEGTAYGLLGDLRLGERWRLAVEGAHSGNEQKGGPTLRGDAWRLALAGKVGAVDLSFTFRDTDAEYLNPANRSLVAGGQPDRTGGDLRLAWVKEKTSLSFGYRYTEAGGTSGALSPDSREHAVDASLSTTLGPRTVFSMSGNWIRDEADATASLSATEITTTGANASLAWSAQKASLAATCQWQSVDNDLGSASAMPDVTTWGTTLTAGLVLGHGWRINTNWATTTVDQDGGERLDSTTFLFQPSWQDRATGLGFTPRIGVTWTDQPGGHQARQRMAQALFSWTPPHHGPQGFAMTVSADWTETLAPNLAGGPDVEIDDWRYVMTMTWTWGRTGGGGHGVPGTGIGRLLLPRHVRARRLARAVGLPALAGYGWAGRAVPGTGGGLLAGRIF